MKSLIYYTALLIGLSLHNSQSAIDKQPTIERCQYIVSQLSRHSLWIDADTGIFSEEFRYVLDNNSKKLIAEYYLEGAAPIHCEYWHENMDDRGGESVPYKLTFEIESVTGDKASVSMTKKWPEPESTEWYFRMILKYESGEWRLHEFISTGRSDTDPAYYSADYEKQNAIDYLAAVPFSDKWCQGQDISKIYEYHLYLDGKECKLSDLHELLWGDTYMYEDFYPYRCEFTGSYRSKLKEPILSVIILTHRDTGERKVLMCTCTH